MGTVSFPKGFVWGAATASYQIEGSPIEDGASPSVWHTFSHTPGKTRNGDTGDVACDHYHRWREDIELMKELGIAAYRFSVSWPRIIPRPDGKVNPKGLDFYRGLVDGLAEAGITPYVTAFHWDTPQWVEDAGGWPARDAAERFADYTEVLFRSLGDRVKHWITLNEPAVVAGLGYGNGRHAPGRKSERDRAGAAHHLLLAHGLAVQRFRGIAPRAQIGITLSLPCFRPLTDSPADKEAADAARACDSGVYLDPLFRKCYPKVYLRTMGADMPEIRDGDFETIAAPIDFLGVNYYSVSCIKADPSRPNGRRQVVPEGAETTSMGWYTEPSGFTDVLLLCRSYTKIPFYITENGTSECDDLRQGGDPLEDDGRVGYLDRHLRAVHDAIRRGVPVKGYFVWSLLDNFEWAEGYRQRFGIVRTNFETLERAPKKSYRWYAGVIAENGL